jgi:hypothetical protein
MLDERRSHVREHRMTVLGFDAEFTAGSSMTHSTVSFKLSPHA